MQELPGLALPGSVLDVDIQKSQLIASKVGLLHKWTNNIKS